ncbi:B12-binding domain-containing radical SAM protein [Youngiibacter fragilis]|uniref:Magnesium-protoporphyrin IX monomethyl ester oxidative cyclase n=1 Tax=Youngiibacter fragilis 232.1 TaxID=994573 RepID=V7I823_9CLOT|nr:radical SAM protein [Youngiibacter fragilis]ETA81132.1 magnesium-protoporphyrin IX monomethyl ester oxidative cyclase [Youngiibacter fragilis 232.1]
MKVFLKKARAGTPFSVLDPVRVEPLELAYLKAAAEAAGAEAHIVDDLFGIRGPDVIPDAIVLTGYNTAERKILEEAKRYKERYPDIRVIVGGTHAERSSGDFHSPYVDFVVHSPDLQLFMDILRLIEGKSVEIEPSGFDMKRRGVWTIGSKRPVTGKTEIAPDRSLTEAVIEKTRYLDKGRVALVKGRIGCPYRCDFCYCRLLNGGVHIGPDYGNLLDESLQLDADHVWIVDDVFLVSRKDALEFIDAAEARNGRLSLIAYLRADFILKNSDLMGKLRECGLAEVIVGFEATSNSELDAYNKQTDALDYPEVIRILRESGIDLTALFMVSPDYRIADFRRLARFLRENSIDTYTVSILTPIKGTEGYEEMKEKLLTDRPERFDFLHLVTKPHLPAAVFYLMFLWLHLGLLRSGRIRSFIRQAL